MTNLCPTIKKELVGVNAIRDGATDNWKPVENHGRLVWISKKELLQDVYYDDNDDERSQNSGDNTHSMLGNLGLQWSDDSFEKSHIVYNAKGEAIEIKKEELRRRRVLRLWCEIIILEMAAVVPELVTFRQRYRSQSFSILSLLRFSLLTFGKR